MRNAILHLEGLSLPYVIQNVSLAGAQLLGEEFVPLNMGAEIALEFDDLGPISGKVCYKFEKSMGIAFSHNPETLKALIQWLNKRRRQASMYRIKPILKPRFHHGRRPGPGR